MRHREPAIPETIINLVQRLRRFGRVMIADAELADRAALAVLHDWTDGAERAGSDPVRLAGMLGRLCRRIEPEARMPSKFAALPGRPRHRPALLPSVWSMPYEERLAVSLLFVEQLPLKDAALVAGLQPALLEMHSVNALARLAVIVEDMSDETIPWTEKQTP